MSARKKEWSEVVGAIVVPSSDGGFMEVTHTPGQGGGPTGRLSSSHGLRPEPTRRGSTPTDPKTPAPRGARGPAAPLSSHRISPRPRRIPSRPTGTRDAGSVVTRQNPKVENGPFDRPRWPGRDFSRSAGHPTKISPIGWRSSGTASEVTWAEANIRPVQRPNLDHWRPSGITGQTGRMGLITRRCVRRQRSGLGPAQPLPSCPVPRSPRVSQADKPPADLSPTGSCRARQPRFGADLTGLGWGQGPRSRSRDFRL